MNGKPQLTQEEIKILEEIRKRHIDTAASVSEIIEPRIFTLLREHIQNVRNIIIVSGALATFSVAFFNTELNKNENFLIIGVSGLLLTVIFGIWYLNNETSGGIKSYLKLYNKLVEPEDKMVVAISQFKNGEISKEDLGKLIRDRYKEVEEEFFGSKAKKRFWKMDYTMDLIIWLMIISIFSLIFSFLASHLSFM